jgi:hypothetical protein
VGELRLEASEEREESEWRGRRGAGVRQGGGSSQARAEVPHAVGRFPRRILTRAVGGREVGFLSHVVRQGRLDVGQAAYAGCHVAAQARRTDAWVWSWVPGCQFNSIRLCLTASNLNFSNTTSNPPKSKVIEGL